MNNDMNNNLFYNKIKQVLSGCRTLDDAIYMCDALNLNKKDHDIMMTVVNAMKYDSKIIDINSMMKHIKEVNACKYKDDAYDKIDVVFKKTNDPVQIRTLQRFANMKQNKPLYISIKELRDRESEIIIKKCPHCGHDCTGTNETNYIICGYIDNGYMEDGYDWKGCGHDWCFHCEKILCKSWENNQLYLPINRYHDKKCCKKHANSNNKKFPEDYCKCPTSFDSDY